MNGIAKRHTSPVFALNMQTRPHIRPNLIFKSQGYGFESHCGQEFFILYFSPLIRSWQVDWSHTNEIKHDVHSRYIGT